MSESVMCDTNGRIEAEIGTDKKLELAEQNLATILANLDSFEKTIVSTIKRMRKDLQSTWEGVR